MSRKVLSVKKSFDSGNYSIESIRFPSDSNGRVLTAAGEIYRSLPFIDKKSFSIAMEADSATKFKIPIIHLIPEISKEEKIPFLLFIHGFDTSKEKVLRYGVHFAAAGYHTVLMDLPQHGERMSADFKERFDLDKNLTNARRNRLKLLSDSLEEVKLLLEECKTIEGIDKNRAGVSGISMGGTLSLLLAHYDHEIKAAASFLSIIGFEFLEGFGGSGGIPENEIKLIRRIDPFFIFDNKPGAAILAQFGGDDKIIDSGSLNIFENKMRNIFIEAPERFNMIRYPGTGHVVTLPMIKKALSWFERYLTSSK